MWCGAEMPFHPGQVRIAIFPARIMCTVCHDGLEFDQLAFDKPVPDAIKGRCARCGYEIQMPVTSVLLQKGPYP